MTILTYYILICIENEIYYIVKELKKYSISYSFHAKKAEQNLFKQKSKNKFCPIRNLKKEPGTLTLIFFLMFH